MVFELTGRFPKADSVIPFDSVFIFFSRIIPDILSRIIFPVDLLVIMVVVSDPIITALLLVTELAAKSIIMVESVISVSIYAVLNFQFSF